MNDLLAALNAAGIRYLLVGGQAMRLYGMPRFSMDQADIFFFEELQRLGKLP